MGLSDLTARRRVLNYYLLFAVNLLLGGCGMSHYELADHIGALKLSLVDQQWDGVSIPAGQQCKKYGGMGASPAIAVTGIPDDAESIIVEFSDRSWFPMNHGGHGKLGLRLEPQQKRAVIPGVEGETFDLPNPLLFIYQAHRGGRGAPGAYLPPCSGGRGNRYFADVKAVKTGDDRTGELLLIAEGSIFLGQY